VDDSDGRIRRSSHPTHHLHITSELHIVQKVRLHFLQRMDLLAVLGLLIHVPCLLPDLLDNEPHACATHHVAATDKPNDDD